MSSAAAGWKNSLQGAKRREGRWEKKRLIPRAGQGAMQMGRLEEASLQRSLEGSSPVTVARLGDLIF
ncbi:hypothetical protein CesoFtcFv8_007267 [Champsocephalus esox]|uniref:Uncharacterized protein n=1 Tax=Champsocephalus esox TaxID=159716 RepID=A0AAN8H4C6_9TELE|nr:hypothetical protein CesoFtcFv8_007267 [Champsocephalus esox]